jgi:hypothetical protein
MAMKFLSFYAELVANFPPYDEDHNLVILHIIQGTQVSYPQLKLCQRIGSQPFDCLRRRLGLVFEPG